jgi:di/tricarboxylate transporter
VIGAALAALVGLLVRGRQPPALVFTGVAFLFLLLGYVKLPEALAHFTNPGLVTVLVLMLVSVVLDKSRLLEMLATRLVDGSYRRALVKLIAATSLYSAVLNNTAVVASLIGPLRSNRAHSASRLLLPMCYAASIGGILTLVGTSTNLLVNSFMIGHGMPGLHMFDLLPVGLPVLLASSVTMLLLFPWLIKPRTNDETPAIDYFVEARVLPKSTLVGRTVEANGLRHLGHLFLSEILRDGRLIAPVGPDEPIEADDRLVFAGDVKRLDLLARFDGLEIEGRKAGLSMQNLVEVIVTVNSPIARRTLREVDFRSQFDAAVVAVRRGDQRLSGGIGSIRLEVGDTLVLTAGNDFDKRNHRTRHFIVVSRPEVAKFVDPWRGVAALAGFLCVIGLAALGWIDFLEGLLVLLAAFLVFGFTKVDELRRHVPYNLVFIIGSALVISEVMLKSGTADLIASAVLGVFRPFGPEGALASILLLAWLLTELMTNNAAAALAFPVALGVSQRLGLEPMPFVMAVIYGASASFLTPYGYQTNLMVMAPGRYTLLDYVRCGMPVALAFLGTALLTIPLFFPLR